jgi:hypothetical protein
MTEQEIQKFKQHAIWTQTLHQVIVQGLNATGHSTPVNAQLSYVLCDKIAKLVTEGFNEKSTWKGIIEAAQTAIEVIAEPVTVTEE